MKHITMVCALALLAILPLRANAVTLTFEDIAPGGSLYSYYKTYGIAFTSSFTIADHSTSMWGRPHSGNNVVISNQSSFVTFGFKTEQELLYASYVGGYFSTKQGMILEMKAYHSNVREGPIATATIGAQNQSWDNVYVEIPSIEGIGFIDFQPVTGSALQGFCMDDLTVNFVPEPSSLLAILGGVAGLGGIAWRRRHV